MDELGVHPRQAKKIQVQKDKYDMIKIYMVLQKIFIVIMYLLNLILISECKDINKSKTSLEFTDFGIELNVETNLCHHLFLK